MCEDLKFCPHIHRRYFDIQMKDKSSPGMNWKFATASTVLFYTTRTSYSNGVLFHHPGQSADLLPTPIEETELILFLNIGRKSFTAVLLVVPEDVCFWWAFFSLFISRCASIRRRYMEEANKEAKSTKKRLGACAALTLRSPCCTLRCCAPKSRLGLLQQNTGFC